MRIFKVYSAVLLIAGLSIVLAEERHFESTEQGIIDRLSTPSSVSPSGQSRPRTRSMGRAYSTPPKTISTRGIRILENQGNELVETIKQVPIERTEGFVNLKIEFDVNSASIRSGSLPLLHELGKALMSSQLRSRNITVIGHTDSDGQDRYNLRLSLRRAQSVKDFLLSEYVVEPFRLKIFGYGEGMPLVPNNSQANKQLNRRVEIVAVNPAL